MNLLLQQYDKIEILFNVSIYQLFTMHYHYIRFYILWDKFRINPGDYSFIQNVFWGWIQDI